MNPVTLLVIVLLVILLGGGVYGRGAGWGTPQYGGGLAVIVGVVVILWLLGVLR